MPRTRPAQFSFKLVAWAIVLALILIVPSRSRASSQPLTAMIPAYDGFLGPSEAPNLQQPASNGYGLVYVANANQLGRTRDFYAPSPSWQNINPGGNATGSIYDFELDPVDPFNVAWVATSDGLWRTRNLDSDTPNWELIRSGWTRAIVFGPANRIYLHDDWYVYYSDTNGATWQQSNLMGDGSVSIESMGIGPTGDIYVGTGHPTGWGALWASYDDGATWKWRVNSGNGIGITSVYSPIEDVVYYVTNSGQLVKGVDIRSYNWPTAIPTTEIPPPAGLVWRNYGEESLQQSANPLDDSFVAIVRSNEGHAYRFCDGCTTGSLITTGIFANLPASPLMEEGDQHMGWGTNWAYYDSGITSPALLSSTDGGATWRDATGNWRDSSVFGYWAGGDYGNGIYAVELASPNVYAAVSDRTVVGAGSGCPCDDYPTLTQLPTPMSINTRTGNESFSVTDISLPTPAGALEFT